MIAEDGDGFKALGNVPTERGARTMAIDPETGRIFLVTADVDREVPAERLTPGASAHPHYAWKPGTFHLSVYDPD